MTNQTAVLDEPREELESPQSPRAILSDSFEARSPQLPVWFRDQQRAAWAKFDSLPYPNRKDQPWRFSNVKALDLSGCNFGAPLSQAERDEILDRSTGVDQVAGRLIFADDPLLRRYALSRNPRSA